MGFVMIVLGICMTVALIVGIINPGKKDNDTAIVTTEAHKDVPQADVNAIVKAFLKAMNDVGNAGLSRIKMARINAEKRQAARFDYGPPALGIDCKAGCWQHVIPDIVDTRIDNVRWNEAIVTSDGKWAICGMWTYEKYKDTAAINTTKVDRLLIVDCAAKSITPSSYMALREALIATLTTHNPSAVDEFKATAPERD